MKEIAGEDIRNGERFIGVKNPGPEYFHVAIEHVLQKIDKSLKVFTTQFPSPASINLVYEPVDNVFWTSSFWTGMLWLAYELTGDVKYRQAAEGQILLFQKRLESKEKIDTHDLGFLYTLSCIAAYKSTGNEQAKDIALRAAQHLATRYLNRAGIIQAWGSLDDPDEQGRMIIDCLLNMPLLYWASEVTGSPRYRDMALNHTRQTATYIVRDDGSSFHTYFFNPETGEPIGGKTHQGYADDSCWARGQAWGIYGFPLGYHYTGQWEWITIGQKMANYFLNRIPDDLICYWDLTFTSGSEERDSSAAAIAVCGLLEIAKHLPLSDPMKRTYENAAIAMIKSLTENYTTRNHPDSNGILLHGVQHKPKGLGVNECCIWGDYFYFEALMRLVKDWRLYW